MNATDWATAASLATALGTLVLAVATFSAIRFTSVPLDASDAEPEGGWLASQSRHWNIDRPDPR